MLPTAVPIVRVVGDVNEEMTEPVVVVSQQISGCERGLVSIYTVFDRNATPVGELPGARNEETRLPKAYACTAIATKRAAVTNNNLFISCLLF